MNLLIISSARSDEGIYQPLRDELIKHKDIEFSVDNEFKLLKKWDYVIVLGDTWPMLDATIRAVDFNIPVAHIHGGDKTGSIDESIRNAITRFAHLHFPSLPEHAARLIKMGEEPWRIKTVGPLGIYAMPEASFIPNDTLLKTLELDTRPIILVIQHPVSTEWKEAGQQIRETLEAVNNPDWQPVVIYPNSDRGSQDMIKVIEQYPYAKFKNLPYLQFLSLLKISSCIVGNSSCGLVEAPLFGVPCVNIGSRQDGRTRDIYNSANIDYERKLIKKQVENIFTGCCAVSFNPYLGFKNGPEIIIETLRNTPIDKKLLEKKITY
jgi:UDP-hydrolysing UDP-N-acetyl-D-glucosamine 2-epimerase